MLPNQPQTARKASLNRSILWLFVHSLSWMTMFSQSIVSYQMWWIIHSVLICIYVHEHVWIPDNINDNCICMSVVSRWEDKPLKQPISMMEAALIWMILSSSVHLHKMWPSSYQQLRPPSRGSGPLFVFVGGVSVISEARLLLFSDLTTAYRPARLVWTFSLPMKSRSWGWRQSRCSSDCG